MAEDKEPNRAERRRQERKQTHAECAQCDKGPCVIAPRVFTECPVCGCPATFTVEAMKGDLHIEDIRGKQAALFAFDYLYDTPNYQIKLTAVGASCVRCGVFYTLARDKLKMSSLVVPKKPGGDGGPDILLPGHGG